MGWVRMQCDWCPHPDREMPVHADAGEVLPAAPGAEEAGSSFQSLGKELIHPLGPSSPRTEPGPELPWTG